MAVLLACGCGSGAAVDGFRELGGGGAGGATTTDTWSGTSSDGGSGGAGGDTPVGKGPPYPVVLAHGFFGFEEFAGLDFATYFYQVREHLADNGEPLVFTPAVDPFNSSEARGAQLAEKVKQILADTGHAKVNLVGHSQGGLDIRVVAHDHPELVASAVSLQTPHQGTPIADIALGLVDDPNLSKVLDFLLQTVGKALYDEIDQETDLAKPLHLFSEPGIAEFNAKYPDAPGVFYASLAGRSDFHSGGKHCQTDDAPPWVKAFDGELDPIDPLLDITEMILDGGIGDPYANDGLVRAKDARRGVFLGCLPADHLDMVGQLFGDKPGLGNSWDYRKLYLDLVAYLRDKGF